MRGKDRRKLVLPRRDTKGFPGKLALPQRHEGISRKNLLCNEGTKKHEGIFRKNLLCHEGTKRHEGIFRKNLLCHECTKGHDGIFRKNLLCNEGTKKHEGIFRKNLLCNEETRWDFPEKLSFQQAVEQLLKQQGEPGSYHKGKGESAAGQRHKMDIHHRIVNGNGEKCAD